MNPNHAKILKKAQAYLSSGKLDRAESLCKKLLKHDEVFLQSRILLAKTLIAGKKLPQATAYMAEAARHEPNNISLQIAAGDMHWGLAQYIEAVPFFDKAIQLKPSNADIWSKYMDSLLKARKQCKEGLGGGAEIDFASFAPLATKALELFPKRLDLFEKAGQILFYANIKDAAKLTLQKCLDVDPPLIEAHQRWMEINHDEKDFKANIDHAEKNKTRLEADPICLRAFAAAYENCGLMAEALFYLDKALAILPNEHAYIAAKGRVLMHLGNFDEALESLNRAISKCPDAHDYRSNRCLTLKNMGKISEAASDELARLFIHDNNPKFQLETSLWDGSPLKGRRLFIYSDQGIGDVFKYSPLIKEIKRDGGQIILASQPKTLDFLKTVFPDIEVRALPPKRAMEQGKASPRQSPVYQSIEEDFDIHFPLGALYTFFRNDIASFKSRTKALHLPEEICTPFRELKILENPNTVKVGLAWSSINKTAIVAKNYLILEDLLPLLKMPGFEFYNFQYSTKEHEISEFREKHNVPLYHAPGLDLFDDLLGTAAFNSCMDLFISPACTSSDIAGSIGIQCLRADLIHLPENLGQDHVPWYEQQQSLQIPYEKTILDYIPEMQRWLQAHQN